MLLRPKTGPQRHDRRADAGHRPSAGEVAGGLHASRSASTLPNVNLEEFFAALDRDTRDYLLLLLARRRPGPRRARARNLSAVLRRFEPTNRDIEQITQPGRQAAQEPRAPDPQLPAARHRARQARQGAGRVGRLHVSVSSGRSPTRNRACARRSGCCRARSSPPTGAHQRRPGRHATSVRPRATSLPGREGVRRRRCASLAEVLPRDRRPGQGPDPAVRARRPADRQGAAPGQPRPRGASRRT